MDTDRPLNLSSDTTKQSPLMCDVNGRSSLTCDWLTELATIATNPQTQIKSERYTHDSDQIGRRQCRQNYSCHQLKIVTVLLLNFTLY